MKGPKFDVWRRDPTAHGHSALINYAEEQFRWAHSRISFYEEQGKYWEFILTTLRSMEVPRQPIAWDKMDTSRSTSKMEEQWREWEEEERAAMREAPTGWGKGVDDSYKLW